MEMKDEIDDEEVSLEDFIDQKMKDWRMQEVEKMYEVASQCLCEKKNKRALVTEVRHIFYSLLEGFVTVSIWGICQSFVHFSL